MGRGRLPLEDADVRFLYGRCPKPIEMLHPKQAMAKHRVSNYACPSLIVSHKGANKGGLERWINDIPTYFQQSGLHVVNYISQPPLPLYRKPWTEDFLLAYAEVADSLEDEEDRRWFKEMHARTVQDAANGWHLDWELITCVGRKALMAAA